MKSLRFLALAVVAALSTLALAQSGAPNPAAHGSADKPAPTEAQKSFVAMKGLAGSWEGTVTLDPPMPQMSGNKADLHVSMRVTSRGNAIVHEMQEAGTPLDPTRYDHPVTMFYLEGDRLLLTHYCDAGNRPRMAGTLSPDGKKVEFEFLDLSGGNQRGHMDHGVFTMVDANHHIEDWTYMMPGDKPMHAHMVLQRVAEGSGASGK